MIEADVIIIGSGVAGSMTAYKLAQKGVKVAILEAGPRIEREQIVKNFTETHKLDLSGGFPNESWAPRPDWSSQQDTYINQPGPEISKFEYLKVVGGTTWHWAGAAIRMNPVELKMKSTYSVGADWPVTYDELEPWYCEAEKEIGVAGDSNVDDRSPRSQPFPMPPIPMSYADRIVKKKLGEIGINFVLRPAARNSTEYDGRQRCQGFGTCSPICPSGAQYSAIVHVNKAEKLGVRVYENTRVDKIISDSQGRIIEVQARIKDGSVVTARGSIFILAANGIESPKLLMMNATDSRPAGLANSSGLVGRNFHEHPGIYCRILMPQPVYPRGPDFTMTCHTYRDGDFRRKRAGWTMAVYNHASINDTTNQLLEASVLPSDLDREIYQSAIHRLEIASHMEQLPDVKNRITLDWRKRDSANHPMMSLHYSYGKYERAGFQHTRETFQKIVKALGAELVSISDPFAHHHLMGTTVMGDDPKYAVVDRHSRSHDHPNLFILGSSVFPTGGCANPTLTIAALALRAASEITRQLHDG